MTAALIIAAGKTGPHEALDPLRGVGSITAIQRLLAIFQRAHIEKLVLVCTQQMQKAQKLAARMSAVCLQVDENAEMFESVKIGLDYLKNNCSAAVITPVDIPLFSVETVRALLASGADAGVPVYEGKAGHPLLLSAEHFPAILAYAGEGGLAGAIRHCGLVRQQIAVADRGILIDIEKEEGDAVERLIAAHSLKRLQPELQLRLARERAFFGPGPRQLLLLTEEMGSLREACRRMGISYSKGWTIISTMEQQLGFRVLESQQGGKAGGHSQLAPRARDLLRRYTAFHIEARRAVEKSFEKYFADWPPEEAGEID